MIRYTTVLLDLDLTLFDFASSERLALIDALAVADIDGIDAETFDRYKVINGEMWAAVERGDLSPAQAGSRRFEVFFDELGLTGDPLAASAAFQHGLGAHGELYPEAAPVLDDLAAHAQLGLVTNGISGVQRAKIERLELERWFDTIVISDEVGVAKPDPSIFDIALAGNTADRGQVVMIGDSLSSDIAGALAAGITACWYNPDLKQQPPDFEIAHEVHALDQLVAALAK